MAVRRSQLGRARKAAGYTQEDLAEALHVERTTVHRWESGRNEPLPYIRPTLAKLLGITKQELETLLSGQPREIHADPGSAMSRRDFFTVATTTAATVAVERELMASIASRDAEPLTQVQTTYAMDHAIAATVDIGTKEVLRRWATDLASPIARVNATGILAKLAGQSESGPVVAVLRRDDEVRRLYLTAVTARVCAADWDQAADFVQRPASFPLASIAAERFAREVVNPTDAGARWCSARMLQYLSPVIGG